MSQIATNAFRNDNFEKYRISDALMGIYKLVGMISVLGS
jgi:hypothetical protein